jgi:hypothetical protein
MLITVLMRNLAGAPPSKHGPSQTFCYLACAAAHAPLAVRCASRAWPTPPRPRRRGSTPARRQAPPAHRCWRSQTVPGPLGAFTRSFALPTVNRLCALLSYGRGGRSATTRFGGFIDRLYRRAVARGGREAELGALSWTGAFSQDRLPEGAPGTMAAQLSEACRQRDSRVGPVGHVARHLSC